MLKYCAAAIVLICGAASPALAQAQAPFDNEQIAQMKLTADRLRAANATIAPPVEDDTPDTPAAPPSAEAYPENCADCLPPRQYDNVEVVKTSRDVDQSRVINTQSVVTVPLRVKEKNKLVIRENETRHVGVVQHNHTIIEKEIRYVKRAQPVRRVHTTYQPVLQNGSLVYWIVRRGHEVTVVPVETQSEMRHVGCNCYAYGAAPTPTPYAINYR